MEMSDVSRMVFGFELWTPARIAAPRLVLGHEVTLHGKLFALRSEVYSPGPFDSLADVQAVVADRLAAAMQEIRDAEAD